MPLLRREADYQRKYRNDRRAGYGASMRYRRIEYPVTVTKEAQLETNKRGKRGSYKKKYQLPNVEKLPDIDEDEIIDDDEHFYDIMTKSNPTASPPPTTGYPLVGKYQLKIGATIEGERVELPPVEIEIERMPE